MKARILVVEDEPRIAQFVVEGLEEEGYDVRWASRGEEGLEIAQIWPADVVVLDIRLPGMSGLEVCRELRRMYPEASILMLTALDAIEDRVEGLRAGADDYLPKPFAFDEFLARIEALLRRPGRRPTGTRLRDGVLEIDVEARICRIHGRELHLTDTELRLLSYFLQHRGEVLSRERIHRDVWGMDFDRGTNLIDVYVSYLRRKLRKAGFEPPIQTIRQRGYRYA